MSNLRKVMYQIRAGDVVVIQDIGLASTLFLQEVYVLSPKGSLYQVNEIHTALDMRNLSGKAHEGGYMEKPKTFQSGGSVEICESTDKDFVEF